MLVFCLPIQHLCSLGCYHLFSSFNLPQDRVGHVTFKYYFANYNYYSCADPLSLIPRICPQQHRSQLQLLILSLTQKILHIFCLFFVVFFSVYKKCFWFTLTDKFSARKVLHISSINNVFYYPTASLHGKGNHCLAPLLIYCTTRFILPIYYQSFKSSLAAALLHSYRDNRFSGDFTGKERHWALLRKPSSLDAHFNQFKTPLSPHGAGTPQTWGSPLAQGKAGFSQQWEWPQLSTSHPTCTIFSPLSHPGFKTLPAGRDLLASVTISYPAYAIHFSQW